MSARNESPQRRFARAMRRAPTDAERRLWWHLRYSLDLKGSHFRRQVQIDRYIVDFVCHGKKIIIEVDGGQHGNQLAADAQRTKIIEANGYTVLRYWNNDVLSNTDGVLEDIQRALVGTPTPNPSPPELGFTRVRHFMWPKSDKSDFGWGGEPSATRGSSSP